MAKRNKMQGKVFLKTQEKDHYIIAAGYEPSLPGNIFGIVISSKNQIKRHYLIEHFDYEWGIQHKVVGLTHSKQEIPQETYRCAKEIAQRIAQQRGLDFVDCTFRAKPSELVEKTQSSQ